jgi:multidrug efflux pump subunit AcrB
MRNIIEFFVRYPIWANSIIVLLLVFGTLSFFNINKSFFPERDQREITVTVAYPGASPEEMEEGITVKIEESLQGVVGIEEFTSTASENTTTVSIRTLEGYNIDEVLTEVKNAVDRINGFPVAAEKPIVFKKKPVETASFLSLRGDVDLFALKRTGKQIENDFLNSGVISQVNVRGFPDVEISIEVSENDLIRYDLTFAQLANAVRFNNRDISGGTIKTDKEEISIRANSKEIDPEQIADIIIRANPDGSDLLLKEVADVNYQFADVPNKVFSSPSEDTTYRSISVVVQKIPEEDLEQISGYLAGYVEGFNSTSTGQNIPEKYEGESEFFKKGFRTGSGSYGNNLELITSFDFFSILTQRLTLLYRNGGGGLVLVLITLGLFLSLRLSFWVAFGIPASFLGMFIVGLLAGITINVLSLFGMILVIGILVDDGIVIAENIYTHFERGKTPFRAAIDGTMEVLPSVFTSVSTTIIAFIPLLLLDNNGFTREMAIVVIAALAFSLVEAFLVLPAHLGTETILRRKHQPKAGEKSKITLRARLNGVIFYLRDKIYEPALRFLVGWKWVSAAIPIFFVLVMVGVLQGGLINFTFFPNIPFDNLEVNLVLKPGTRETITQGYLEEFENKIWAVDRELEEKYGEGFVKYVDLSVGNTAGRGSSDNGSHTGNLRVSFYDERFDEYGVSSFQFGGKVRNKIGSVPQAEKFTVGGSNRFGSPVNIALLGSNLEELKAAKEEFKDGLGRLASLKDITDNNASGRREIKLELKPKAYFLGLNQADITNQIRRAFFGEEAQKLQIGDDEVRVWVRYPQEDRVNISQLEEMKIKDAAGNEYPLQALADYDIERGVITINRFNGKREVRIDADLENSSEPVPPILEKIQQDILPPILAKYPSVEYSIEGQQRRQERVASSFSLYGSLAFAMMVLVITLAFRSFYQAILIILLIPLGVFCAILGHGIVGIPVSILSIYGMIGLSGVIINDAVVMLDKYNRNLREGMVVQEAAIKAGTARFRAILLTSITTVAGLYPIILETSFQAQFVIPMAVSVAYGVLFGTLLILLFFPVLMLAFNDIKVYLTWAFRTLTGKNKPSQEDVEPAVIEQKREMQLQ